MSKTASCAFIAASLLAANLQAANTNAPVIIDANATAIYINDGSRTNRYSPPVPGVRPLKSLTPLQRAIIPGNTVQTPDEAAIAPQGATVRRTLTAQPPATTAENPLATYRFIDKRPLGMNPAPAQNQSVHMLDEVPKETMLSPAR